MLNQYVNNICEILNIITPNISFDTTKFKSKTMLAMYDTKSDTIYLKKTEKPNLDLFFCDSTRIKTRMAITTH